MAFLHAPCKEMCSFCQLLSMQPNSGSKVLSLLHTKLGLAACWQLDHTDVQVKTPDDLFYLPGLLV